MTHRMSYTGRCSLILLPLLALAAADRPKAPGENPKGVDMRVTETVGALPRYSNAIEA